VVGRKLTIDKYTVVYVDSEGNRTGEREDIQNDKTKTAMEERDETQKWFVFDDNLPPPFIVKNPFILSVDKTYRTPQDKIGKIKTVKNIEEENEVKWGAHIRLRPSTTVQITLTDPVTGKDFVERYRDEDTSAFEMIPT
jgi:hypothetical protein